MCNIFNIHFTIVAGQSDSRTISPTQTDINISHSKASLDTQIQNYDGCGDSFKAEERLYGNQFLLNNTDVLLTNVSSNDGKNSFSSSADQTNASGDTNDPEQSFDGDKSLKPSRIPILKTKHLESTNSISSSELSNKCANSSGEDCETLKMLNASCIPTSPVTGKKYRSPISMQPKLSDRLKKASNGSISNNNTSYDNLSVNGMNTNMVANLNTEGISKIPLNETPMNMNSPVNVKIETNSGRSTPIFINNESTNEVTNSNIDKYKDSGPNDLFNSERKPTFKWMFGPHKNANVVRCFLYKFP